MALRRQREADVPPARRGMSVRGTSRSRGDSSPTIPRIDASPQAATAAATVLMPSLPFDDKANVAQARDAQGRIGRSAATPFGDNCCL
jgi:hypothetical protein